MVSLQQLGYNVFSVLEAPRGWSSATSPDDTTVNPRYVADTGARPHIDRPLEKLDFASSEHRWEALSGRRPQDSVFTVLVPVHEEEKSLGSFLGALMFAPLPPSLPMQLVFIVNGSTDRSAEIIREMMQRSGPLEPYSIPYMDAGLTEGCSVTRGNARIILLETSTPSKANALNIGTSVALSAGHRVTLSLDSDVWAEPSAIPRLYGDAIRELIESNNPAGVITGSIGQGLKRDTASSFMHFLVDRQLRKDTTRRSTQVMGQILAWDAEEIKRQGGFHSAIEDYAIGLRQRLLGKRIFQSPARIWSYAAASVHDRLSERIRWARGKLQLLDTYGEAARPIIEAESPLLRPWRERVKELGQRILHRPTRAPFALIRFGFGEYILSRARSEYAKAPSNESWEQLSSSRSGRVPQSSLRKHADQ